MDSATSHFKRPGAVARAFNLLYGWLTDVGLTPSYSYLLQVQGRKTGKLYSMPVNVLSSGGKLFLVGTRGHTQWSRNARAGAKVTLKKGRVRMNFQIRAVPDD